MTEAEWDAGTDPVAMLEFLRARGRVDERRLRPFAVACLRRVWGWIDERGRFAIELRRPPQAKDLRLQTGQPRRIMDKSIPFSASRLKKKK